MLTKNARASVATVTVVLITGLVVALWMAVFPPPAQAQAGDVLRLLSIKAIDITNDEGGRVGPIVIGDEADEPYIEVDGEQVWSGQMNNGKFIDLGGISKSLSGASATVQLKERDPGTFNSPDDFLGEFSAEFTGGDERTHTINFRNGEAVYQIRYVVDRPPPDPAPDTAILSGPSGIVNATSATFEFFADTAGSTFECRLDGVAFEPCSSPKVYSNLSVGDHAFEVRARTPKGVVDNTPAIRSWTVNAAPVAKADRYRVKEDKVLLGRSVLGNDSDANGDPLKAKLVRGTSKGKLTLRANGTFTYKPKANFNGTGSFTYRASDGLADSNIVKVTIRVVAQPN
jgi:hypothetical protein